MGSTSELCAVCMTKAMEGTALDAVGISISHSEPIILQKINMDKNNEETVTEQGLALDSANHCTPRVLDDDSGAGANAGSMTEMMFVTANPLSELVWSPHIGLSLKCADSSLSEKKPSLMRGIESTNMVLSPPEGITSRETNNDEPGPGENFISTQMASNFEIEVSERGCSLEPAMSSRALNPVRSPKSKPIVIPFHGPTAHEHNLGSGGTVKDSYTVIESSVQDFNQKTEDRSYRKGKGLNCANSIQTNESVGAGVNIVSIFLAETSLPGPEDGGPVNSSSKMDQPKIDLSELDPLCADPNEGTSSNPFGNPVDVGMATIQALDMVVLLPSEVSSIRQGKASTSCVPFMTSPYGKPGGEEHGLATENNLCLKDESAEVGRNVISQPSNKAKYSPQQNEGVFPKDQPSPGEASPNNSGVCPYQLKSKKKYLSDGKVDRRITKKNESHESVESCNSAGSFSAGKRPWRFESQLVVSNKKPKKETHKTLGSASFERSDSSFMNWISNMMKGLSKSDPEEKPSSAHMMRPPHELVSQGQQSMPYRKNLEPGSRSMGFQAIFQSLYLPRERVQDSRTVNLYHQRARSKEPDLANMICDKSCTPLSCDEENDKLWEQSAMSNEKFNQGTSGGAGPSTLPNISSPLLAVQAGQKSNNTAGNNILCACGSQKGAPGLSNVSFPKDSNSPSGSKETNGFVDQNKSSTSGTNRGSLFCSAWISRFSPQVSGPLLRSPQCKHNIVETNEGSTDSMRFPPQPQNCAISSKDQKILGDCKDPSAEYKMDIIEKMQHYAANASTSFGLERIKRHDYQKGSSKFNPILPFKRFRSSEDMASVFARRLDALRNIIPSVVVDCETHESTICLFCGKKGHNLRDCSMLNESELEDILKCISSYDKSEESPSLCIRCFQLNHWAISCPNAPLRTETQLDGNASLVNFSSFRKMKQNPGKNTLSSSDDRNLKPLEKDSRCQVADANNTCEGEKSKVESGLLVQMSINKKVSGMMIHNGWVSDLKTVKNDSPGNNNNFCRSMKGQRAPTELVLNGKQGASSFPENESKENRVITPFRNIVTRNIPDVPKRTFEAIKRLRLSRLDILKWTASPISASHLDGFFLRLRIGKWEEGLGGTGYHVACINGAQREKPSGSSRISLSVSIGGCRCSIESRYVSNHDFTEDELLAWSSAMSRGGGKLPSEDNLKMKLEEREKLGF
ncbi:hypothetical protein NE237_012877 [Protea cynaroides]|uniref:Uncharacterized protein n=1 Tax=Protea cynaroides TaxID=273540 RepID=A0A9Q0H2R0_9MAGN|nr:hypothetical protein NE237_012877 [Protea cynaroides]